MQFNPDNIECIMSLFYVIEYEECDIEEYDEYNRYKTTGSFRWDNSGNYIAHNAPNFKNLLFSKLNDRINHLVIVDSVNEYTIFRFLNFHIALKHTINGEYSQFELTKLSNGNDRRGFEN